jgi:fimbrial chaperone protein
MPRQKEPTPIRHLVFLLSSLGPVPTLADGSLISIDPVRITLSSNAPASQLEMGNGGDAPDLLQSEVFRWTRQHCQDSMESADGLVVSPPIFTVRPDSKQVVRILLTDSPSPSEERTLRVVLTEIGMAKPDAGTVATRLSISLPVFILPSVPAAPKVEWSVTRDGTRIQVTAHNAGNAHTRLKALRLVAADGTTVSDQSHTEYLLAGDSCDWSFAGDAAAQGAHVVAITEERETVLAVPAS